MLKRKKICKRRRAVLYEGECKIDRIDYDTIDELNKRIKEKGY